MKTLPALLVTSCIAQSAELENPEILSSDISDYLEGKRIVLFGEDHSELQREDAQQFIEYLPQVKQAGFTHIGLEIDAEDQSDIDAWQKERKTLGQVESYPAHVVEDWKRILDVAKEQELSVLCIDTRKKENRDIFMKRRIDRVLEKEGKIAVFIGATHVSTARRESMFPYSLAYFRPLGNYLVSEYGKEEIGLVDLNGCMNPNIPACVEEK